MAVFNDLQKQLNHLLENSGGYGDEFYLDAEEEIKDILPGVLEYINQAISKTIKELEARYERELTKTEKNHIWELLKKDIDGYII